MAQSDRERLAALPNTILFIVQHLHKIFLIMDCLLAVWLPYTRPPAELRTSRERRLASRVFFYRTFNYFFLPNDVGGY